MPRLKGQLKAPSQPLGQVTRYDRCLLYGLGQIGEYMGCTGRTVRTWIKNHALPCGKLPHGSWVISTAAIDSWIAARNPHLHENLP